MHLNVDIAAITRDLPRHLRVVLRQELERRLEARIGQLTTVADIQRITQDVLRRMRTLQ
jgi:hypothetical protein